MSTWTVWVHLRILIAKNYAKKLIWFRSQRHKAVRVQRALTLMASQAKISKMLQSISKLKRLSQSRTRNPKKKVKHKAQRHSLHLRGKQAYKQIQNQQVLSHLSSQRPLRVALCKVQTIHRCLPLTLIRVACEGIKSCFRSELE